MDQDGLMGLSEKGGHPRMGGFVVVKKKHWSRMDHKKNRIPSGISEKTQKTPPIEKMPRRMMIDLINPWSWPDI